MGGRRIQLEIKFFYILTMIAFIVCQTKKPFFYNAVLPVPESRSQAENLVSVTKPCNALFTPAVGIAAGQVVVDIGPGLSVRTIILPDSAPLTVGEIGTPFFPVPVIR